MYPVRASFWGISTLPALRHPPKSRNHKWKCRQLPLTLLHGNRYTATTWDRWVGGKRCQGWQGAVGAGKEWKMHGRRRTRADEVQRTCSNSATHLIYFSFPAALQQHLNGDTMHTVAGIHTHSTHSHTLECSPRSRALCNYNFCH